MSFNTLDTARFITLSPNSQTFTGAVNLSDPIDHYRIQLNGKSHLQLSLTGLVGNANAEVVQDLNQNNAIESNEILYRSTNGSAIAELINTPLNTGTYFIRVSGAESTNYQLNLLSVTAPTANLLWRNMQTGDNAIWTMEAANLKNSASLPALGDRNWQIVGSADFNADSRPDLVWRNLQTGENALWYMNGATLISSTFFTAVGDRNWQIVGVGDFNRDTRPDLVWRNQQTGENALWYMNGSSISSTTLFTRISDLNWRIVGAADFDRNGNADLIWRNQQTGENALWYMNGANLASSAWLPAVSDRHWQIVSVTDFNQDSNADLVWRHSLTGENAIWYMNGTSIRSTSLFMQISDLNWRIVGANPRSDEPVTLDSLANTRSTAFYIGALDSSATFSERVSALDEDFYQFALNEVTEATISLSTGATLQLFDAVGNLVQMTSTIGSSGTTLSGLLNRGTYFVRVSSTSSSPTPYNLSLSGRPRPIVEYSFTYYYNGQNTTADYYSGTITAFAGTYAIGQFYDLNPSANETGANGRYFMTSSRTGTLSNLNRIAVNNYYDSETGRSFTPIAFSSGSLLGSEYGWLADTNRSDQYFGSDSAEADFRSIAAVQVASSLRQGITTSITWSDTIDENVRIDLYKGGIYHFTIASSTASDGIHNWMTTNGFAIASDYQIRVFSVQDNSLFAMSHFFAFTSPGTLRITSPNGGNLIRPNSTQMITWTDDIPENVVIELYRGGIFQTAIAASTASNGSFAWTVPNTLSDGQYQIRIASTTNPYVSDWSDAAFTIQALGDPGNTLATAEFNNAVFSRTQQVSSTDQNDFYRFSVGQSGVFTANLAGLTGDADVRLIQDTNNNQQIDQGEVIAWQWERGSLNESIRRFITAGSYFLQVMNYNNQTANYTLTTNFTAAAADDRRFDIQFDYSDSSASLLNSTMRTVLEQAAAFWERVIPFGSFSGWHILTIQVRTASLFWSGSGGTLAQAGPNNGAIGINGQWMPTAGTTIINSNSEALNSMTNDLNYFRSVMIHEIAHILGIGTLWDDRLLTNGTSYIANSYAGWAYGELIGTRMQTAVPLDGGGGHWDEGRFSSESMTPSIWRGEIPPVSAITIASLRDLGWNVNYGAADAYTLSSPLQQASSTDTPTFRVVCGCQSCLSMTGQTDLRSQLGLSELQTVTLS